MDAYSNRVSKDSPYELYPLNNMLDIKNVKKRFNDPDDLSNFIDVMYHFGAFKTNFYAYKNNNMKKQEIISYHYELI